MRERTGKSAELRNTLFAVGIEVAIFFLPGAEDACFIAKSMVGPGQQNAFGKVRRLRGSRCSRRRLGTGINQGCI
jgi:hypothetical protein